MKHTFTKPCTSGLCPGCHHCQGDWDFCLVCHGSRNSLTTHCPGVAMKELEIIQVEMKQLDYYKGAWVGFELSSDKDYLDIIRYKMSTCYQCQNCLTGKVVLNALFDEFCDACWDEGRCAAHGGEEVGCAYCGGKGWLTGMEYRQRGWPLWRWHLLHEITGGASPVMTGKEVLWLSLAV